MTYPPIHCTSISFVFLFFCFYLQPRLFFFVIFWNFLFFYLLDGYVEFLLIRETGSLKRITIEKFQKIKIKMERDGWRRREKDDRKNLIANEPHYLLVGSLIPAARLSLRSCAQIYANQILNFPYLSVVLLFLFEKGIWLPIVVQFYESINFFLSFCEFHVTAGEWRKKGMRLDKTTKTTVSKRNPKLYTSLL